MGTSGSRQSPRLSLFVYYYVSSNINSYISTFYFNVRVAGAAAESIVLNVICIRRELYVYAK